MTRVLAIAAGVYCVATTGLWADADKDAQCALFGQMSAELVELRRAGSTEADAAKALADKYGDQPEQVQMVIIPALGQWVFGLTDDEMAGDVAGAMTSQCKEAV